MPVYRMKCSWQVGSEFPRDRIEINPVFNDTGLGTDPENLCDDLSFALVGYGIWTNELTVTAYDAMKAPPSYPVAEAKRNTGNFSESLQPRELAVCLSFYSGANRARNRGRLFLPVGLLTSGAALGARPAAALQTKAGDLAGILAGLGGVDVDWVVHSRKDATTRKVSNWWVDDEWDVQRKRGLRGTSRVSGSTSG